jgi:hypothetical protein
VRPAAHAISAASKMQDAARALTAVASISRASRLSGVVSHQPRGCGQVGKVTACLVLNSEASYGWLWLDAHAHPFLDLIYSALAPRAKIGCDTEL